jgi:hypothetical protein
LQELSSDCETGRHSSLLPYGSVPKNHLLPCNNSLLAPSWLNLPYQVSGHWATRPVCRARGARIKGLGLGPGASFASEHTRHNRRRITRCTPTSALRSRAGRSGSARALRGGSSTGARSFVHDPDAEHGRWRGPTASGARAGQPRLRRQPTPPRRGATCPVHPLAQR